MIPKKFFEAYEKKTARLCDFIKIFKPELKGIEIEKKDYDKCYRCNLKMVYEDCRQKGFSPVYLLTDHTGFYERYGWEFLCMVQGDGESEMSRMYIHY